MYWKSCVKRNCSLKTILVRKQKCRSLIMFNYGKVDVPLVFIPNKNHVHIQASSSSKASSCVSTVIVTSQKNQARAISWITQRWHKYIRVDFPWQTLNLVKISFIKGTYDLNYRKAVITNFYNTKKANTYTIKTCVCISYDHVFWN